MQYVWVYLAAISLTAVILTFYDKRAAMQSRWRIKESTLLLVSAMGGSAAMLLVMLQIRHKTRRAKFMIGIPVMIVLQIIIASLYILRRV